MTKQQDSPEPKLDIPIDDPISEFEQFLKIADNKRIFFSGQYGVGKTRFLQEFFKSREQYDVYHLFPIKYQINSNENIIELLRYDILVELVKKYPRLLNASNSKQSLTFWQKIQFFAKESKNQESLLNLASAIPKLGRPLAETIKLTQSWREMNTRLAQSGIQKMHIGLQEKETNELDVILSNAIQQEKKREKKEKSILILDDFERIDPEHIFRILNVFSSLLDKEEDNKFGFDCIIIVGDIENIKKIFHHRYGKDVDFRGYFDKFYTYKPYYFDNRDAVSEQMSQLIATIQKFGERTLSPSARNMLLTILTMIARTKNLNLREFYQWLEHAPTSIDDKDYFYLLDQSQWSIDDVGHIHNATSLVWLSACLRLLLNMFDKQELKDIVEANNEPEPAYPFSPAFSSQIIELLCESKLQSDSEEVKSIDSYYQKRQRTNSKHLHQKASKSLVILIDAC